MIGTTPGVDREGTIHDYIPGQPIPIMVRDPRSGRVVVNELKRYVKPYTLVMEPESLTLDANALSDPIPMVIDSKGHFEIMEAFFASTQAAGFTVQLFETKDRPLIMNREIHVATFASGGGATLNYETLGTGGSGGRPFKWPETLFIDVGHGARAIIAVFRNLANASNTIRFALHGQRWYHTQAPPAIAGRMEKVLRTKFLTMPYFFTTETLPILAASASGEFDIRFTDEAWVEWMKGMSFSTGNYNVRIREKASSKRLMELAIRNDLVFGNGELPFLNWEPSLFEPNYKLTLELEDLSGAENRIWITLACRKIMWDPKDDRLLRPEDAGGMP